VVRQPENQFRDTWEHMKKGFSHAYKALGEAREKSAKEFGTKK
jgi:hypothetical protein